MRKFLGNVFFFFSLCSVEVYIKKFLGDAFFFFSLCSVGVAICCIFAGCTTTPAAKPETPVVVAPTPVPTPVPVKPSEPRIALYWELTTESHPERAPWSDHLVGLIRANLSTYLGAEDITTFCPMITNLDERGQIKAIAEMWVAVAYYESGFNPKSQSVDVGTKENKDSWSVGLFQMSVTDIKNYGLSMHYNFDDLNTAIPNEDLANAVMVKQIKEQNRIVVSTKIYWATLAHKKYDKVSEIAARVRKNAPGCL